LKNFCWMLSMGKVKENSFFSLALMVLEILE
jgi:hypothetical protein